MVALAARHTHPKQREHPTKGEEEEGGLPPTTLWPQHTTHVRICQDVPSSIR